MEDVAKAREAVLVKSNASSELRSGVPCKGYDFKSEEQTGKVDYDALLSAYKTIGFQATNFGAAVEILREMNDARAAVAADPDKAPFRVFLGFTSNMISSGVRESIKFLVKNKKVDVLVSSAGGVEEDIIKCLAPHEMGAFSLDGRALRAQGLNRIGNLIVPNANYCLFEDWLQPLLETMLREQKEDGFRWTPSRFIRRLGLEINDEASVLYWAAKNDIPVFCPALTDGSIGDMLFFHTYKEDPALCLDIVPDVRAMNESALQASGTGMVILGGGLVKHHICNANLMRNGADYAVFVNTGAEFDGSDAGARPDEAISWGKLRQDARYTKVYADATLAFPLLVAQAFVK